MTIKERIQLLWDQNGAVHSAYPSVANATKWCEDLLELPENVADTLLTAVEIKDAFLKKQFEDTEYIRLRQAVYPSMADQLDIIFHGGLEAWHLEIQRIKDLYPKPEEI